MRFLHSLKLMKAQALWVQKSMLGSPNCWEALIVKDMTPSEKMQVTGGAWEWLSFEIRLQNGIKQCFLVESQRAGMLWVESMLEGGRPSGMVSNWKFGKPMRALGPLDLTRRWWLKSVLTKVMWKPLLWRSFASLRNGFMWPCDGNGIRTACGFLVPPSKPIIFDMNHFVCHRIMFIKGMLLDESKWSAIFMIVSTAVSVSSDTFRFRSENFSHRSFLLFSFFLLRMPIFYFFWVTSLRRV